MTEDTLARRTLRCRTVATGGFRQLNYVRDLPPIPVEERLGAEQESPIATPMETLLASLGSCLATRIHAQAAAGALVVRSLELDVEADLAASAIWEPSNREPSAIGIEAIRVTVRMDAQASAAALRSLVARAVLWSPIASTLYGPVHIDVVVLEAAQSG